MSERFDALMIELSAELASIPPSVGDDMIRMSAIERGDRLEVLCDRLAERASHLTLTLALLEQEQIVQGRREGTWICPRCLMGGTTCHAIYHADDCPFSVLTELERAP